MSKGPFADWSWTPELVAKFARANAGRKVRGAWIYNATVEGHIVAHDHDSLALHVGDGNDYLLPSFNHWKMVSSFGSSHASKVIYPRDLEFCDEHGPHSRPFEGMPPATRDERKAAGFVPLTDEEKRADFARAAGAPNLAERVDVAGVMAEAKQKSREAKITVQSVQSDAMTAALSLIRDLPTRHLAAPMRARALEVERALAEALRPVSAADQRGMDERNRPGDACARMVAAYDD